MKRKCTHAIYSKQYGNARTYASDTFCVSCTRTQASYQRAARCCTNLLYLFEHVIFSSLMLKIFVIGITQTRCSKLEGQNNRMECQGYGKLILMYSVRITPSRNSLTLLMHKQKQRASRPLMYKTYSKKCFPFENIHFPFKFGLPDLSSRFTVVYNCDS